MASASADTERGGKNRMSEIVLNISQEEAGKVAEIIQKIASGTAEQKEIVDPEPITSWEMADIFKTSHTRIYNQIERFVTAKATEEEKKCFEVANRTYRRGLEHPIWKLSEKGCELYIEKISKEEKRSKTFVEGLNRFEEEVGIRFHGKPRNEKKQILMEGRSRSECGYIKELFDRFVTGPAIENREIEELGEKYKEFYQVMGNVVKSESEKSRLEDAVMGVAVEAEMQGFIYGFKVFEVLASRAIATV